MITPAEFVAEWEKFKASNPVLARDDDYRLRVAMADDARLSDLPLPAKQFLLEAGLPKSFSSLIYFHDVSKGLKRIWEVYGPHDSWTAEQKEGLSQYIVIGSDDQDNPICLDESNEGRIVLLDHDDYFNSWQFVNSSIVHLVECLLAVDVSASNDELRTKLENIDAPAVEEKSFWQFQLT